ncbi:Golgin subfamily A member 7/ERF4 family-domain-containing protein [Umbelopsis sp. AD052]|nr:Golgin subfamily A member 7/ERF4 family-domain-containing protein [Umbelopsis sp. AD052]
MDSQVKRRHTDTFVLVKPPPAAARTPHLRTRHSIQLPARKPAAPDTLPLISLDDYLKSSPSIADSSIHHSIYDPMAEPTEFIRIERDYSLGDGITKFSLEYPQELHGKISEEQLRYTVMTINDIMHSAERLSNNVFDNIMEILTIYLWPIFFSTHYQRSVKRLMSFIDDENKNVYNKHGLSIANPIKSAFLFLELRPSSS